MQLRFQMENYLKSPADDLTNYFSNFLCMYADAVYTKRIHFAKDINVTPVLLSQIINNYREPNEEFILKLMVHSEVIYKNVSKFDTKLWYKVYFQEKLNKTMASQEHWQPKIEKLVKVSEPVNGYNKSKQ